MKIGILTFHRARNNGAFLQCYALQETLKKLGYEAFVIDYRQPAIEKSNTIFSYKKISESFSSLRGLCRYVLKDVVFKSIAISRWNRFRKKYLNLTTAVWKSNKMVQDFDVYLIGSDQLWNRYCTLDYDSVFFGNFLRKADSRVCGYAISTTVDDLKNMPLEELKKNCENFFSLSFRESKVCDYITSSCSIPTRLDIDPTLLLGETEWETFIQRRIVKKSYILTCFLGWNYNYNEVYCKLNKIADKEKCIVVDISCAKDPIEFLSLIKFAKKIYTTSFHGTVFSLIFKKNFYAISDNTGTNERYRFLLEQLDCLERFVPFSSIESLSLLPIDYNAVEKRLKIIREKSIDYLRNL